MLFKNTIGTAIIIKTFPDVSLSDTVKFCFCFLVINSCLFHCFNPGDVEMVRIHEGAPYGYIVYRYPIDTAAAWSYRGNELRVNVITESSDDNEDKIGKHFGFLSPQVDGSSVFTVVVGEFPVLSSRIGDTYFVELAVVEMTGNSIDGVDLTNERHRKLLRIVVSRRNEFPPRFASSSSFFAEVHRYAVQGTPVQMTSSEREEEDDNNAAAATDDLDVDDYNKHVSYSLRVPRAETSSERLQRLKMSLKIGITRTDRLYLMVNEMSGEITTGSDIRRAPGVFHADLIATNRKSSPPLSARRSIIIYVCDISS